MGSLSLNPPIFQWLGYVEFKRHVQIRDETSQRNPITNFKFAYHIGRSVDAFIKVRSCWNLTGDSFTEMHVYRIANRTPGAQVRGGA